MEPSPTRLPSLAALLDPAALADLAAPPTDDPPTIARDTFRATLDDLASALPPGDAAIWTVDGHRIDLGRHGPDGIRLMLRRGAQTTRLDLTWAECVALCAVAPTPMAYKLRAGHYTGDCLTLCTDIGAFVTSVMVLLGAVRADPPPPGVIVRHGDRISSVATGPDCITLTVRRRRRTVTLDLAWVDCLTLLTALVRRMSVASDTAGDAADLTKPTTNVAVLALTARQLRDASTKAMLARLDPDVLAEALGAAD